MDPRVTGQVDAMLASSTARRPDADDAAERPARASAASFRDVFDEQYAFVWRSLLHLGVPEAWADDGAQEVFLVVHRRLETYDHALPLRAWLWGIARHVAQNQKRSLGREARRRDALATERGESPDVSLERARELRFVREILMTMDEALRDVLVLSDVEGLTAPEIAAALDANVNTIYSRLRIARQRFADAARRRGHAPEGGGDARR
jgi:RNA polymerase sigma-70 factor (ECF subfamily)